MFQTFISRHNSNFFSDKLVLTSVTPASSAPVLQTPKATSSTLYFDSLTVNAGNGGLIHTPTAISIFVCLSMVQLMAVFISMRCTLCGHFLQVALTLILVVGYAIAAS